MIVHIGRHKSGTSSLQHFLASQRTRLDRNGYLYPLSGRANRIAHHALAYACNPNLSDDNALPNIIRDLQSELRTHHSAILFSSEAFQNITDLHRLNNVAEALGARKTRVICYVREHLDYAISSYRQMVQNQPTFMTFDAYVGRFTDLTGFLDRWRAFGDLTLKWYDRTMLKDGDIVADFCELLAFEPGKLTSGDRNPSIGGNLLVYKLALNHLGLPGPGYNALRDLAITHAPFRAAFHVSEDDSRALRAQSGYNKSLFRILSLPKMKTWNDAPVLPALNDIEADLKYIGVNPEGQNTNDCVRLMQQSSNWFKLTRRCT